MSGVRAARGYLRAHRRTSAGWTDWYTRAAVALFAAALLGGSLGSVLPSAARDVDPSQAGAGLALVALAYAGFLTLARRFGPVALPAADASWLLLSPLPRRGVLARSAAALLVLALAAGAVLGVALLAVLGLPGDAPAALAGAVLPAVAATVGGAAAAVLAQASPPWDTGLQALIAGSTAAAAAALLLGAGPGREVRAAVADATPAAGPALAVAGAVAAALLLRLAWRALDRVPARSILDASTRTGHVTAATVGLDPAALTWIAEEAHWRGRTLRSRPWPARAARPAALAWIDWRRLARRPGLLCALLASAAGPALGVAPRAALAARSVLPLLLGGAWLTLALAAPSIADGTAWWAFGPAAAPALAAGALRMARRRPVDHAMPTLDTPFGSVPTGPVLWAATGLDVAALGCAPLLAALSAPPAAIGPYLAVQAVTGVAVLAAYLAAARR
ncbi:DUF6297 family protein [Actinomadura rifamycini]|uniref:DUF6297 family protein n=1 Tax=Actinomadura rifamycini TaxID=31962 RepID=UPI00047E824A|nr:DUF6297 family protein [Actinomadura rifamycini]